VASAPATVLAGFPAVLTAVTDDTRYGSGGWGNEPVQKIAAARYTVDAPSWTTGVISYPMSAADGTFGAAVETVRATVSTVGLPPGRHVLFVEGQDTDGHWGVPSAVFLRVVSVLQTLYLPLVVKQAGP